MYWHGGADATRRNREDAMGLNHYSQWYLTLQSLSSNRL